MSKKPLTPWVICDYNLGKILCGHCDCMTGLGESCSYVASLLWAIEAGVKQRQSLTVTEKPAYWVLPPPVKSITYVRVKDINFLKKRLDCHNKKSTCESKKDKSLPTTSSNDKFRDLKPEPYKLKEFLNNLQSCGTKPAILSIIEQYATLYVPKSLHAELPKDLSCLYDSNLLKMDFAHLLELSEEKFKTCYEVNEAQHIAVEENTRKKFSSRMWFRMRAGRVTASRLKAVCHTSLINSISYPELMNLDFLSTKPMASLVHHQMG